MQLDCVARLNSWKEVPSECQGIHVELLTKWFGQRMFDKT